jgi:hypothetical protein
METVSSPIAPKSNKPFLLLIVIPILLISSLVNLYLFLQNQTLQHQLDDAALTPPNLEVSSTPQRYQHPTYPFSFTYTASYNLDETNFDAISLTNGNLTSTLSWIVDASSLETTLNAINEKAAAGDLAHSIAPVAGYPAYHESQMSAEGSFERHSYIETNGSLLHITTVADTHLPGNEEPEIYTTVESHHNQLLSTLTFVSNKDTWNTFTHPEKIYSISYPQSFSLFSDNPTSIRINQ